MIKRIVGVATGLALIAAPTMAAAAPASFGGSAVAPASETVSGAQLRGGVLSPWVIILLIDLALLIALISNNNGNPDLPPPTSP